LEKQKRNLWMKAEEDYSDSNPHLFTIFNYFLTIFIYFNFISIKKKKTIFEKKNYFYYRFNLKKERII
jgi:hypothetical protein